MTLNHCHIQADDFIVSGILDSISNWFARLDKNKQAVVQVLVSAAESDDPVGLEADTSTPDDGPFEMTTHVRDVRADRNEVVIAQPHAGSQLQPLITNQKVRLIVSLDDGLKRMNSTVLGRVRMNTPGGGTVYGYRLALPGQMFAHERRRRVRPEVVLPDSCIEVTMKVLGRDAPVHGVLVDLTASSCEARSTNARDRIEPGQDVLMKLALPEPVGDVTEHVRVTRVMPVAGDEHMTMITLRFREAIPGLRDLLASGRVRMSPR